MYIPPHPRILGGFSNVPAGTLVITFLDGWLMAWPCLLLRVVLSNVAVPGHPFNFGDLGRYSGGAV